jgi:predicted nucleic-acid-binding protein
VRAIDTNVVVRFLTGDDRRQAKRARAAFDAGDIFISATVLLETEWVLRSGYGYTPARISAALRDVAGTVGVTVEAPGMLARALNWLDEGMDFADAMHLARAEDCDVFLSFDRKLAEVAVGRSPIAVEQP